MKVQHALAALVVNVAVTALVSSATRGVPVPAGEEPRFSREPGPARAREGQRAGA
jgi:hypothetical protein